MPWRVILEDAGELAGWLIACFGAMGLGYKFLAKPVMLCAKGKREEYNRRMAMIDDLPGTLFKMNDCLEKIGAELRPNGGGSIKDKVNAISDKLDFMEQRQDIMVEDAKVGAFYAAVTGENITVNRTYARRLGCDKADLLGLGWKNYVYSEDFATYSQTWREAFSDGRELVAKTRMQHADGAVLNVTVTAYPVKRNGTGVVGYRGVVDFGE